MNYIDSSSSIPSIANWLDDIKSDVEETFNAQNSGEVDNVYFNEEFAKHFLRLCKLFPLWSAISCSVFGSPASVSSSANVESYFKDVKHVHRDIIPCPADVFAQNHIDRLNEETITASQQYAKFIGPKVTPKAGRPTSPNKESDSSTVADAINELSLSPAKSIPNDSELEEVEAARENSNEDSSSCFVCRDGNSPSGAHTCILCAKKVHTIDGCSKPVNDGEGYGTKRICMECSRQKEEREKKSQQTKDALNTKDEWNRKSKKSSYYMSQNPQFDLVKDKQKIGLLKYGNLSKKAINVKGKMVAFEDTSSSDALIQAMEAKVAKFSNFPFY